ncbi:MAG: dienelactone hydrolase [Planctomycetota bacterium]
MQHTHLIRTLIVTALAIWVGGPVLGQSFYKDAQAPFEITIHDEDLHDPERGRDVPVKVYAPVGAEGPRPVVLISHGLGGSREGLSYLGKFWASHGYVCIVIQHVGSDDSIWRDVPARERLSAMRQAVTEPKHAINRTGDVTFVIDTLEAGNGEDDGPLHGDYDLDKLAIAGHSFGAWTCLAAGGMTLGSNTNLGDERIKCMIPLSSPAQSRPGLRDRTYGSIRIPALHMTGTLDTSVITNMPAEDRRIPYDHTPGPADHGASQYLVIFDGADHMTFGGETGRTNRRLSRVSDQANAGFHKVILHSGLAFLDANLFGDDAAQQWLNGAGFLGVVEPVGTLERKLAQ